MNAAPSLASDEISTEQRYRRDQVAERGGVDRDFVDRLVDLGILSPDEDDRFTRGDVRRAAIVQTLVRAGVQLDALDRAVRSSVVSLAFADAPTYDRFPSLSSVTFAELTQRTAIPLEVLTVIREATGSAPPRPNDRVRDDELRLVPLIELQLANGVRPVSIEHWLRVYGDGLHRIAETEVDWWHSDLLPFLHGRVGPSEMMHAANELSRRLAELGDEAVLTIYHAQQAASWRKSIIEGIEEALEAAGLHSRVTLPPAIGFLDLTGYTQLTEEDGDAAAADLAARLRRVVQRIAVLHDGEPIKWLGDGVMLYFPDPPGGVLAALEMVECADEAGLPPARVGLHAGPVLFQEGDYFGRTVNAAARIAAYAKPGEVLVSKPVVEAVRGLPVSFTPMGAIELKGLRPATEVWTARRDARTTIGSFEDE
jgi:adenylate cyclase